MPRSDYPTMEEFNYLVDRVNSMEAQINQLSDTLKMLLVHQAQLDSHINDVVRVRNWWKINPPMPPAAYPNAEQVKRLMTFIEKLEKAGLI